MKSEKDYSVLKGNIVFGAMGNFLVKFQVFKGIPGKSKEFFKICK